jgi:AraC family transcriptional regulator of arabinose operon
MSPSKIREQMRTVVGKDIILEDDFSIEAQPTITTPHDSITDL